MNTLEQLEANFQRLNAEANELRQKISDLDKAIKNAYHNQDVVLENEDQGAITKADVEVDRLEAEKKALQKRSTRAGLAALDALHVWQDAKI